MPAGLGIEGSPVNRVTLSFWLGFPNLFGENGSSSNRSAQATLRLFL